jgi:hypothetical protein
MQLFHRSLLESPQRLQHLVQMPRMQPVTLVWAAVGQTSGIAFWIHEQAPAAVSVIQSGLDPDEDKAAIETVCKIAPLPFPPEAYDSIQEVSPPLLANLYCTPKAIIDPAISTGSVALAAAYFGMLGVGEEEEREAHSG